MKHCFYSLRAALVAALFILGGNACGATVTHYFPGSSIALEDGDIILNDTAGPASAFNQKFGFPFGPYSHASLYIEFPDTGGTIVGYNDRGIVRSNPDGMLSRNFRLALLRPLKKPASGVLIQAFNELSARPLVFNHNMSWPALESNQTYCAGFISQLYRLAGLTDLDPFPGPSPRPASFWDDWTQQHLDLDLRQIVSPNAPLSNPNFQLLAQYQSGSRFKAEKHLIAQTTMNRVETYMVDEHLDLAAPKPGSQLLLKIASAGVLDGIGLMNLPEQKLKYFLTVYEFMVRVENRVRRSMRLSDTEVWSDADIQELTQTVADAYRDEFFVQALPL